MRKKEKMKGQGKTLAYGETEKRDGRGENGA
jgi:hypothetical protein